MAKEGIEAYLGIMGVTEHSNQDHQAWISSYPELKTTMRSIDSGINPLKRFSDGSYYEDWFAEKVAEVLTGYGFAGLHVTDSFCPLDCTTNYGDFSDDIIEQFEGYLGHPLSEEITSIKVEDHTIFGIQAHPNVNKRADLLWRDYRADWVRFYSWRWEKFWKKICDKLHSIGKKVFVIGTYCTDPFESLYYKGVDLRKIVKSGVDYLMPNPVPCGNFTIHPARGWWFYDWMIGLIPLIDAFVDAGKSLMMLGVKDSTEEWDMLHHRPTLLERDIYYASSHFRKTKVGLKRCIDGFIVCLGDGIYSEEWKWLYDRFEIGFGDTPEKIELPTAIWSDSVLYNTIDEYVKTRRWSNHKFLYELADLGGYTGAVARIDDFDNVEGNIFVPNFDLLSEEEKHLVATYDRGGVICTASAENGFSPERYGIAPDIYFEDSNTPFINCAFAYNMTIENKSEILECLEEIDDSPAIDDPFNFPEIPGNVLAYQMPFQKVSKGFLKACVMLLKKEAEKIFNATSPVIPMVMKNGALRLYIVNEQ